MNDTTIREIASLATILNGASSVMTAVDVGFLVMTDETISAICWNLLNVADRLEALKSTEAA
jgi:hypothetical protein